MGSSEMPLTIDFPQNFCLNSTLRRQLLLIKMPRWSMLPKVCLWGPRIAGSCPEDYCQGSCIFQGGGEDSKKGNYREAGGAGEVEAWEEEDAGGVEIHEEIPVGREDRAVSSGKAGGGGVEQGGGGCLGTLKPYKYNPCKINKFWKYDKVVRSPVQDSDYREQWGGKIGNLGPFCWQSVFRALSSYHWGRF